MNKYWKHFKTITKHRWIVFKLCCKCGLFKRGLLHDLSKYGPTEFIASAKHFQGNRSPIEAEKEDIGYSLAWQHHKGHNPHHWEYWLDNLGTRKNTPIEMPFEYMIEMICDWLSAGIVYSDNMCDFDTPYTEALKYYNEHLSERIFHPRTQQAVEHYLRLIAEEGINAFCAEVAIVISLGKI